jgi:hypothetical protein
LLLAAVVVAAAILLPPWKPKPEPEVRAAPTPVHLLEIVHYHRPGAPDSERTADVLNQIKAKYGEQVLMTRVDVVAHPDRAVAEKITRPPKVVMLAGTSREFEFSGWWPLDRVERKVDEILHKLKRVGKDWRPPVGGMTPGQAPVAPGAPAQPPIRPAR